MRAWTREWWTLMAGAIFGFALLFSLYWLASCGGDDDATPVEDPVSYDQPSLMFESVETPEGHVPCVLYEYRGGVSCDWSRLRP